MANTLRMCTAVSALQRRPGTVASSLMAISNSGACRTFEMLVHGLTESKSREKNVFRVAPQSHNPFLQERILFLAPELSFDRPRKNTGCFPVYQTSYDPKIYDTDTFVMRKLQLADCPFGIRRRLATTKSYSILWPPFEKLPVPGNNSPSFSG